MRHLHSSGRLIDSEFPRTSYVAYIIYIYVYTYTYTHERAHLTHAYDAEESCGDARIESRVEARKRMGGGGGGGSEKGSGGSESERGRE